MTQAPDPQPLISNVIDLIGLKRADVVSALYESKDFREAGVKREQINAVIDRLAASAIVYANVFKEKYPAVPTVGAFTFILRAMVWGAVSHEPRIKADHHLGI